jgi:hypothetical protein
MYWIQKGVRSIAATRTPYGTICANTRAVARYFGSMKLPSSAFCLISLVFSWTEFVLEYLLQFIFESSFGHFHF